MIRMLCFAIAAAVIAPGLSLADEASETADEAPQKTDEAAEGDAKKEKAPPALDFKMKALDGKDVHLAKKYDDKVVLMVNVASKCGLTPQYKQLQALHEKYKKAGLAIVAVPCNQFGKQEPGTATEIREFCTENYGIEFDILSKVDVNGDDACDLYKYLTSKKTNPKFAGEISWNFEKFLYNSDGKIVARFEPRVKPGDKKVVALIEKLLKEREAKKS